MTEIHYEDIDAIALAATIYGSGGGGDPHVGSLLAKALLKKNGPIRLVPAESAKDDDLILPVAIIGAPTVAIEKLGNIEPMTQALEALGTYLGTKPAAIVSMEAGGLNSMAPLCVASQMHLPLIDADGMGRAFPQLEMTLCTLQGLHSTPMAISDEKGNISVVSTISNAFSERLIRAMTMELGGMVYSSLYPMRGRDLKKAMTLGFMSLLLKVGRDLVAAKAKKENMAQATAKATGGKIIAEGKVVNVSRWTDGKWHKGQADIEGLEGDSGKKFNLSFQNEILSFRSGDKVLASTPDIIALIDTDTGAPITAELITYGLRVTALAIDCVPEWRTPAGLALVGPRCFGYDFDYAPFRS